MCQFVRHAILVPHRKKMTDETTEEEVATAETTEEAATEEKAEETA